MGSVSKIGPGLNIFVKLFDSVPSLKGRFYQMSYFPQVGLMRDDCISYDRPIVKEAILRLPKEVREARQFRIIRAISLSTKQRILPKSEWMTIEQDKPYFNDQVVQVYEEGKRLENISKVQYDYKSQKSL